MEMTEEMVLPKTGGWIQTYTGRKFSYIRQPHEHDDIDIIDIARGLSRESRFCGQTGVAYCVAQHSVLAADEAELRGQSVVTQYLALLHDATEAYMKDIPSPLKALLPEYKVIEESVWKRISMKFFGIIIDLPPNIKAIDNALFVGEANDLFSYPPLRNHECIDSERVPYGIDPWSEAYAYDMFMRRFQSLSEAFKPYQGWAG